MRIAVAGGTGVVGRHVVTEAEASGHEAVVLSRSAGVDLVSGEGLAAAMEGADAVIDVAAPATASARESVAFFETVTRRLLDAEAVAGVGHHVALSIVGAARIDAGYYAGKAAQERMLAAEPVERWSLLRTTQFFEFAAQVARAGRIGPVHLVPTMLSRPVAAVEVARELVSLATGPGRGVAAELAGPQELRMPQLVRRVLRASGRGGVVVPVPLPGAFGRGLRDGAILPGIGARVGRVTVDDWIGSSDGPMSVA